MLNYLVLVAESHQIFLPALPIYSAYQSTHGRDPVSGTEMLNYTGHTIIALHGHGSIAETAEKPLVTVIAEVDC